MLNPSFLDTHSHILVDQLASNGLPSDFPTHPVVPTCLENEAHLLPLLISLRELSAKQVEWLLDNLSPLADKSASPICATLLASTAETKDLVGHLSARVLIRRLDKVGGTALLRYYDPRVFAQLQWMLSIYQMRALFGPVDLWSIYLEGAWHTVQRSQLELSNWVIDAKCCARLDRIGLINETLRGMPSALRGAHTEIGKAIDESLIYAQQHYQFERNEDRVAFALHAMTVHREFDRHPTIQNLIGQLATESQTYADATALLNESDWQRIGIDLSI